MTHQTKPKVSSAELSGEEFGTYSPGFILRRVVDPATGGSDAFRMSLVTLDENAGTPRHLHNNSDEGWYVVSGTGLFYSDGKTFKIAPGDFLYAGRGVVHQLINLGHGRLTYVAVTAPPADFKNDNHVIEQFDRVRHAEMRSTEV
ncbi:MAG: cupin domain-containing protein [Alphaproteobacteria bacterium]